MGSRLCKIELGRRPGYQGPDPSDGHPVDAEAVDDDRHAHAAGPGGEPTVDWSIEVNGVRRLRGPVVDDHLYVTTVPAGSGGRARLLVVDPSAESVRRRRAVPDDPGTVGAPVVHRGRVLVLATADGTTTLHAWDADTGEHRWRQRIERPWRVHARSPTVAGGVAYVRSDHGLVAVDVESESVDWRRDAFDVVRDLRRPAVAGDHVVVHETSQRTAGAGIAIAVVGIDGDLQWQRRLHPGPGFATAAAPVTDGTSVFVTVANYFKGSLEEIPSGPPERDRGGVLALDAASRETQWELSLRWPVAGAALAGRTLLVTTVWNRESQIHAVDVDERRVRWTAPVDTTGTLAVTPETAYTRSSGLVAVDLDEQAPRWRYEPDGTVMNPVVVDDAIYAWNDIPDNPPQLV
ncbi:hypothetical protein BRD13_04935, partial [Halobacteriales archaeon SW_5_70_135]